MGDCRPGEVRVGREGQAGATGGESLSLGPGPAGTRPHCSFQPCSASFLSALCLAGSEDQLASALRLR